MGTTMGRTPYTARSLVEGCLGQGPGGPRRSESDLRVDVEMVLVVFGYAALTCRRPCCRFDMVRGSSEGRWLLKDPTRQEQPCLT